MGTTRWHSGPVKMVAQNTSKAQREEMHPYLVYCLQSHTHPNKSYIGCTINFPQRLRQHNGEITGGARYTRGFRPWKPVFHVTGLLHSEALKLEYALKKKRVAGKAGIAGRRATLEKCMQLERWTSTAPRVKSILHRIKIVNFL
jgi:predicted GIY-YIG superfamily endonuclease